jgi:hypothetical protein
VGWRRMSLWLSPQSQGWVLQSTLLPTPYRYGPADDFFSPPPDGFAQRAGPVDLPPHHHRLPRNARTIVGNDFTADHSLALWATARAPRGQLETQAAPCPISSKARLRRWRQLSGFTGVVASTSTRCKAVGLRGALVDSPDVFMIGSR